jgi:hypothetical protein
MANPIRALTAFVLIAAAALAACSPSAVASLLPVATGPLVTVTTRGGECPDGPCGSTVVIERNGQVHQTAPKEAAFAVVAADTLAALDAAVRATNFDAIRSRKFTGQCPTAYDGQEVIYEFGAPGGVQRIASCETEIDPSHPVFAAVAAVLAGAGTNPAP